MPKKQEKEEEVESAEEPERNITDNALIYNRKNKK